MSKLQEKYALITGASQGLGFELAIAFARAGVAGIAIVARNKALLNVARDLIQGVDKRVHVLTVVADVSEAQDIERIVATTLNAFGGRIDILVNNASTSTLR